MKLASWNVNGLRAIMRKGGLVSFLADQRPDLLCLQEIKLKPEQVDFEIDGYQLILNSAERAGYSGTGLLIKNELIDALNKPVIGRNFGEDIEDAGISQHQITSGLSECASNAALQGGRRERGLAHGKEPQKWFYSVRSTRIRNLER